MRKVFVIWNEKQNRPVISFDNYGCLVVFLTMEQAQAFHNQQQWKDRNNYYVKEMTLQ